MNKNKDQMLLENIYDGVFKKHITENMGEQEIAVSTVPENQTDDYIQAEQMILKTLDDIGSNYADQDSESFKDAVESVVAAMQHSPEELDETVQKIAFGLDKGVEQSEQEPSIVNGFGYEEEESPMVPSYESKTLLNAYTKVIMEARKKKKKNNEYAICTASVGRENEAKYKRCKEKVKKQK